MTEKIEAKVTHKFKASPERVYDAFLDPARAKLWQRAWLIQGGHEGAVTACEIDPHVGGKFLFADRRNGEEARYWGTYLELARPKKIAFTWITDPSEEASPSIVTMIIEPEPDGPGAIVTLYHEMDARWADYRARTERGWGHILSAIDALLTAEG
jgi:uncharacterized protein YndB with AHSA1/START domain